MIVTLNLLSILSNPPLTSFKPNVNQLMFWYIVQQEYLVVL